MALMRISTVWTGSAGSPFFTQQYYLGAADAAHASDAISAWFALIGAINAYIDDSLVGVISGDAEVIDVATGQITSVVTVPGATTGGIATGDALPTFVQGLIRLNTGTYINGRQLKGHIYVPGMMEANNTVNGLPSATMTGVTNAALATYIADSCDPAVYSRTHFFASSVQSATMSSAWSYLRSRRD